MEELKMLKNLFKKVVDFVKGMFIDDSGKEYRIVYDDSFYRFNEFSNYFGGVDCDGDNMAIDSAILSKTIEDDDIKEFLNKINNAKYIIVCGRR